MADPVSVASGLVALITFGLGAGRSLCQTVQSLKSHPKVIRKLKTELEGLAVVLKELEEAVRYGDPIDFVSLKLPLQSCGCACSEFNKMISACTQHTSEEQWSLRDWLKLRYRDSDLNNLKDNLASYKSTIHIALGGINM